MNEKNDRAESPKIENPFVFAAQPNIDAVALFQPGQTLLDHFAGLAMQGIITAIMSPYGLQNATYSTLATEAYTIAEAMLKERSTRLSERSST